MIATALWVLSEVHPLLSELRIHPEALERSKVHKARGRAVAHLTIEIMIEEDKSKKKLSAKAVEVLEEQMQFYQNKAQDILLKITNWLENEDFVNILEVKDAYKLMEIARDKARDCAAKLAPYQSPRLESIETNNKTTHQFVVKMPSLIESPDDWLKQVHVEKEFLDKIQAEAKVKLVNGHATVIEDINNA